MHLITKTYNRLPIEFTIDNNELYINATKTARYFGREAKHWKYTKFPMEYFKAYNKLLKEYSDTFNTDNILSSEQLIVSIHGGKAAKQGTWINKKLIFQFTSWLDMQFAIWCDYTIKDIFNKENNALIKHTQTKLIKELEGLKEKHKKEIEALECLIFKNNSSKQITEIDGKAYNPPYVYSATYLLKKFKSNLLSRDFYTLLENKGLFVIYEYFNNTKKKTQKLRKFKEDYNDYGYNKPLSKKTKLPYSIMFYEDKFEELLDIIKK